MSWLAASASCSHACRTLHMHTHTHTSVRMRTLRAHIKTCAPMRTHPRMHTHEYTHMHNGAQAQTCAHARVRTCSAVGAASASAKLLGIQVAVGSNCSMCTASCRTSRECGRSARNNSTSYKEGCARGEVSVAEHDAGAATLARERPNAARRAVHEEGVSHAHARSTEQTPAMCLRLVCGWEVCVHGHTHADTHTRARARTYTLPHA